MGCDIHICIEAWSERETFRTLFKGDRRLLLPRGWSCVNEWKDEEDESRYPLTWCHRNYNLFAILADVRNGIGFAGIDTGEGFIPISAPKGLPDDVTAEVKQWSDGWGVDGHSHSFLTLAEIFEFDWTRTTKCREWSAGLNMSNGVGGVSRTATLLRSGAEAYPVRISRLSKKMK